MLSAVIFDMDGTMVDTEKLWGDVNRRLAEHYGKIFDPNVLVYMMGKKDTEALAEFKTYFDLDANLDELVARRREMILEDISLVQINPGLIELLDLLDRLSIKKAIATSSFRRFMKKILSHFNLENRFDVIVTGDEVMVSKPNPEIFLKAASLLNVSPQECLVLEDAQNGVERHTMQACLYLQSPMMVPRVTTSQKQQRY